MRKRSLRTIQREHFQALIQKRANAFWAYSYRMAVKQKEVTRSFRAESGVLLIECKYRIGKYASNGCLIVAAEQIVPGKAQMAAKLNMLIPKPKPNLVPDMLRTQRESR
jgi:hypothetical protein